ncbi:MAG: hypothetical protein R6U04_00610 [Bacteroidales bacterium]
MKNNDFKIKLIVGLMFIIGITSFVSCEKDNSEITTGNDYSELSLSVKSVLESIGQSLREQNSTFDNRINVKRGAKQFFSEESKAYDAFLNAYDESVNSSNLKTTFNNEIVNSIISDIEGELINSNSPSEFIDYLEEKFDEVSVSDIDPENKDVLLKYIISYKTFLEFINNNVDLIANQSGQLKSTHNWWDSWGRCAAGIVDGAGLGALTGGAAASVIPVLDTTAEVTVGGVSGGLSGAAAAC